MATFDELLQIVESNARAIQALTEQQAVQSRQIEAQVIESGNLRASVEALRDIVSGQQQRISQLIGYSITGESDRLNLEQRIRVLEQWKRQQEGDRS